MGQYLEFVRVKQIKDIKESTMGLRVKKHLFCCVKEAS